MKEKIEKWIFCKCLQIAERIEPVKFNKCLVGIRSEVDFTTIVPPDGKDHHVCFTFASSL